MLPASSFAVHIMPLVPNGYPLKEALLVTATAGSTLSVTDGAARGTTVRAPVASTTRSFKPLIVGGV